MEKEPCEVIQYEEEWIEDSSYNTDRKEAMKWVARNRAAMELTALLEKDPGMLAVLIEAQSNKTRLAILDVLHQKYYNAWLPTKEELENYLRDLEEAGSDAR